VKVQLSDDCFAADDHLMTTAEALNLLSGRIEPIGTQEMIPLRQSRKRVLAEDVISDYSVPPKGNSAVDGYSFAFESLRNGQDTSFRVVDRAAAGHPATVVPGRGEAIRVLTGAVMPSGHDTVAMQEDCEIDGDNVVIPPGLSPGANSRRAGEDVEKGDVVLRRGQLLRAQDLGIAASVGRTELSVYQSVRVAVFSTGDEIREPGKLLPEGAIYDSNRYVLMSLLEALPVEVIDLGILPDDPDAVAVALRSAAQEQDILLTSGGVSVGEEDHVKNAVSENGSLYFWRLAIKPGRPLALGQVDGTPFVGLPGNPVAAMVTFIRFARPLLLRLAGGTDLEPKLYRVRADFSHRKKRNRREWVRARLKSGKDGTPEAEKFAREGAGILRSLVDSDGLIELPEDMTEVVPGTMVEFLPFAEVIS
tara:strand:+ start:1995 stop:3254 length:1260 start_codon:yes stop_codon:yes gene_type:complete